MVLSPAEIAIIGLLFAAWTVGAGWLMLAARARMRAASTAKAALRRAMRMFDASPAIPLIVHGDGRIEGPDRLAAWLGLSQLPEYLSELDSGTGGLAPADLARLSEAITLTQKTAMPFQLELAARGSRKSLVVRGQVADPQVTPGRAALVWWADATASAGELSRLRREAADAQRDFGALVGLIEAAPMPMWFRGPDGAVRLVNRAYVEAVGARDAGEVVARQIELIEPAESISAPQVAAQALATATPVQRDVQVTIGSQRRTMRVSDLPLGAEGVAGYAVDIEVMEEQARALRAFQDAQRSMLDQFSVGVAQFDGERRLVFANQPFRKSFALPLANPREPMGFAAFLDHARDQGRLPEMRDFPAWRAEAGSWFLADKPIEEAWSLADHTHLRILAQPMPDGGLVLVAEDRSEQLALSATRDTLLRTRTATFNSLFESRAVFAPDGRMQLWNRSFPAIWGLADGFLDSHPRIEQVLEQLATRLSLPAQHKAIGEVVRSATLDRRQRGGRVELADGRILEFAGVPLPDGNGLLTVLDVTASARSEQALRERAATLEEADAVKTRFLANMSYEFRTPLTSIGGFAELLQGGVAGPLSVQAQDYVSAILTSVERLSQQIESVLDLTQSEAGLLPMAADEIDLLEFASEVVRTREAAVEAKDISLDLRGNRGIGRLTGDRRQLARAFGNVLDNAIAAVPQGGRIFVGLLHSGSGRSIVVSDNGPGLSAAEAGAALDGISASDGGRGLGLPLARRLIEAHGGKLELQSQKGAGTTVTIALP